MTDRERVQEFCSLVEFLVSQWGSEPIAPTVNKLREFAAVAREEMASETVEKAEATEEPRIYRIIRFRFNGRKRTIKTGLTRAEAHAHCAREDTHGPGWFDGFDLMRGVKG